MFGKLRFATFAPKTSPLEWNCCMSDMCFRNYRASRLRPMLVCCGLMMLEAQIASSQVSVSKSGSTDCH